MSVLFLNDKPCMVRLTLIDTNHAELKYYPFMISLILICLRFLGVRFKVGRGGGLNYLEIWHERTHSHLVSENILFSTKSFLIFLMSAFFAKNQSYLAKIVFKAIV